MIRLFSVIITFLMIMPVMALIIFALSGSIESFLHFATTVLPKAALTTFILLFGVALLTGLIGTLCAWLVSFFEFTGRPFIIWALMLPLAVPTYLSAYAFVEFFTFAGSLQSIIRKISGFHSANDYWFPEVRSLGGAIFIMSLVLYPYVYLAVRVLFLAQGQQMMEAARLLGGGQFKILRTILLPLARPAIVLGITLALIETLNDVGASEYLGIHTLTFSVFSVWLNQDDLAGAAQISSLVLTVVIILVLIERCARASRQRYSESRTAGIYIPHKRIPLKGLKASAAFILCILPILAGFGIPFLVLIEFSIYNTFSDLNLELIKALTTSIFLAISSGIVTVTMSIFLSYLVRIKNNFINQILIRIATIGYAIPGTIIALGIFLPIAALDNFVDHIFRTWFGISTGLLVTMSGVTLIYAYSVRFMAIAEGSVDNGFAKLSQSLDMAARTLGSTTLKTLLKILLPIIKPALATAFLLVFIDSLKELSATMLLRPFGVNTLSVYIYDFASQARVEEAGLACLMILFAGIIPVIVLSKTVLRDRM